MPQISEVVAFTVTLVFLLILFHYSQAAFVNLKVYEHEWLKKVLNDPMNNVNVRPTILNTSEPIEISVSLQVRNFEGIDDHKMEYSLEVNLIQEWEDDRLAYAKYNPVQLRQIKFLTLLEPEKIWRPDLYFLNGKSGNVHSIMKPNNFARIYSNGTVLLSTRLSLKLGCPMTLKNFPFDSPICSLRLASYAFTREDLIFKWKPVVSPIKMKLDGSGSSSSSSKEFVFDSVTSNYCDSQTATGGVFSCLLAEFHFHRSRSYYLRQNFIPIVNLVVTSWLSFLLDNRVDKTFLMRGVVCLTTMSLGVLQVLGMSEKMPRTTYSTSLDVWNGISLTFIFFALAEFIGVTYLTSLRTRIAGGYLTEKGASRRTSEGGGGSPLDKKKSSELDSIELQLGRAAKVDGLDLTEPDNFEVTRGLSTTDSMDKRHSTGRGIVPELLAKLDPEKIEKWSLILYPTFYFLFICLFWLVTSSQQDGQ